MTEQPTSALESLFEQATAAYQHERYDEAAQQFKLLGDAYRTLEDSVRAAEMDNNCSVALLQGNHPQEALEAVLGSDQIFALAGDARRQAMALGNIAAAHEELKQYDRAYELYVQSAELLKDLDEPDLRSFAMQRIAGLKLRQREPYGAFADMRTAVDSRANPNLKDKIVKFFLDRFFGPRSQE